MTAIPSTCPFTYMPLTISVASYLNQEELAETFALINKYFNRAARADPLWAVFLKERSIKVIPKHAKSQVIDFLKKYCSYFNKKFKQNGINYKFLKEGDWVSVPVDNGIAYNGWTEGRYIKVLAIDEVHPQWKSQNLQGMNLFQVTAAIDRLNNETILRSAFEQELKALKWLYEQGVYATDIIKQEKTVSLLLDAGAHSDKDDYTMLCEYDVSESLLLKVISNCKIPFDTDDILAADKRRASEKIRFALINKTSHRQSEKLFDCALIL